MSKFHTGPDNIQEKYVKGLNLANACIGLWDCVEIPIPLDADESLKPADVLGICFGAGFEPWAGWMWCKDLNLP